MNYINMSLYRLFRNKSTWIILCLTILITVANVIDKNMGDTIYERFVVSINNGNWTLMFVFVAGRLVNAFMKNEYLKNLAGIIPSKIMCYVFAATTTIYISVVILINIILAIGCKYFLGVKAEFGVGKEEQLFLLFSLLEICVIALAVIIIALVTRSSAVAIVLGLVWSGYIQDLVSMQIKKFTSYNQIVEIVVLLIICIFVNYIFVRKREVY